MIGRIAFVIFDEPHSAMLDDDWRWSATESLVEGYLNRRFAPSGDPSLGQPGHVELHAAADVLYRGRVVEIEPIPAYPSDIKF